MPVLPGDAREVLKLKPNASREEIEAAYQGLMHEWRAERYCESYHLRKISEEKRAQIQAAYDVLVAEPPAPPPPAEPDPAAKPEQKAAPRKELPPGVRPILETVLAVLVAFLVLAGIFMTMRALRTPVETSAQGETPAAEAAAVATEPDAAIPDPQPTRPARVSARPEPSSREPELALSNGQELIPSGGRGGSGTIRVINQSELDAIAKLHSRSLGTVIRAVFVRAGHDVALRSLGADVYTVTLNIGEGWQPSRGRFARHNGNAGPYGPFTFIEVQGVEGPQADNYEIVLKPQAK